MASNSRSKRTPARKPAARKPAARKPAPRRRSAAEVARQKRQERDLFGLLVGGTAVYALLVLWLGVDGAIAGGWLEDVARALVGAFAIALPLLLVAVAVLLFARAAPARLRGIGVGVALTSLGVLLLLANDETSGDGARDHGGWLGGTLHGALGGVIGDAGVTLLALVLTAGGLLLATGASVAAVAARSHQEIRLAARTVREAWPPPRPAEPETQARVAGAARPQGAEARLRHRGRGGRARGRRRRTARAPVAAGAGRRARRRPAALGRAGIPSRNPRPSRPASPRST